MSRRKTSDLSQAELHQSIGKYLRCYQAFCTDCSHCGRRKTCLEANATRRRVLASSCYSAFFRGHSRVGTPAYLSMMRLRKIWAEGSFSVLKREHCLSKIRKRGIPAVTEECLLSVMALNLKRMVKAFFFLLYFYSIRLLCVLFTRIRSGTITLSTDPYCTLSQR